MPEPAPLLRAVATYHDRRWLRGVIAVQAVAALAALATWPSRPPADAARDRSPAALPPPPSPSTIVVPFAVPFELPSTSTIIVLFAVPFELPSTAPPPAPVRIRTEGLRCPPPRTDPPITVPMLPDQYLVHAATAPTNVGWIVAWNWTEVFVSFDAGTTFTRILDGDDLLDDVTFDCFGRVIVSRGGHIGIYDGNGSDRWDAWRWTLTPGVHADPPGVHAGSRTTLIGGGPDLVVVDNYRGAKIAISRDTGATWSVRELVAPEAVAPLDGEIQVRGTAERNGMLRLSLYHVRTERVGSSFTSTYQLYDATVRGQRVQVAPAVEVPGPIERYGLVTLALGNDGVYEREGRGSWRRISGLPAVTAEHDLLLVPGPLPSVLAGEHLYRIVNGRARREMAGPDRSLLWKSRQ